MLAHNFPIVCNILCFIVHDIYKLKTLNKRQVVFYKISCYIRKVYVFLSV